MKKTLIIGTALAALAAVSIPTAATAEPVSSCQALPVATPGISVLGQRIPAASDVSVCVLADTVAEAIPVIIQQPECGEPCFTVEIEGLEVSEDIQITVRLKLDGQQQEINYTPGPIAVDPASESGLCVIGVGSPDPCIDRVTTPRNLTAAAKAKKGVGRIDLAWGASKGTRKSNVVGYQVWRSLTGEAGTFEQLGAATTTTFSDTSISSGQTYWYYVVAWDDAGRYSPASNTASATAK